MEIREHVPVGPKTTMRIGGEARYYTELHTKEDCEKAVAFAKEKGIPLHILGGGSNTIFADGTVDALIARIKAEDIAVNGNSVTVQSGKILPVLINDLAEKGLDLSPLTGIPGSVGGAIIGNAGQGADGVWMDEYVQKVTALTEDGWKDFEKSECCFSYRESIFKHVEQSSIIWEVLLHVPENNPKTIQAEIEQLLQKRIETQPHVQTAGSCFKAVDGKPAWKFIDAAGLRGRRIGNVSVSEKHANFLINEGNGTFDDAVSLVRTIEDFVDRPLDVEMRFIKENGELEF